ncbi:MAG: Ig-like domain-containing protein [Verrucomicrobia bacterium]|nr:Ig-like domain-containing protein [Verrucomicrobiota bacterium]
MSITSPTNGTTVLAGTTQTIQATATDSDGTVTKVEFYASGQLIGTVFNTPFNFTTNVPAGNFALTAVAYDNSGASNISAAVNIQSLTNATLVLDPALPNQPAFHISNAVPGQTYFIDALTNFTGAFGARWFPIATNTAPSGDFTFSDAVVPAGLSRLYRVRQTY